MSTRRPKGDLPIPRLGLWDAVSIIIGIVIGTAIFRSPAMVFQNVPGPWWAMAVWAAGGALSWCGAVCYAELATTYPRDGGDYEYLNRAFGPWCGFLFGWAQLTTVVSGNIAIMAYAFADYGMRMQIWPGWRDHAVWITVAPVVVLSIINAVGVVVGKFAQNILSVAKVLGIACLAVVGLSISSAPGSRPQAEAAIAEAVPNNNPAASLGIALVFVLYAYGGWNHAAYVAAEVRDQRRNLPRALFIGISVVTLIYLAVNATYVNALGFDRAQNTLTPAAEVMEQAVGAWGSSAISVLVMLSALAAINGMILTGTRIYATLGADYRGMSWLAAWNRRVAAPTAAIAVQAVIAVLLILLVGTASGRDLFDSALRRLGVDALPWDQFSGGFETLIAGATPVFWALTLLTGCAVFVLRSNDKTAQRPFSIPFFPLPPLVFCGTCAFMLYSSVTYAGWLALVGVVPLVFGLGLWFVLKSRPAAQ